MPVYVGLLRGVNLGGSTQVRMEDLRALLSRVGFEGVQSLLQSGNVVFRSDERDSDRLEKWLEERAAKDLQLRTDFFLRTADEWSSIISGNPFAREAEADPSHLVVTLLKVAPPKDAWGRLDAAIQGRERVRGGGRHAYIVYPDGIGRSRLTAALIEKNLGTRGTSRNWNTVTKLALVASDSGTTDRISQ
jgi:uncharacterized protein (DUF1697 family)